MRQSEPATDQTTPQAAARPRRRGRPAIHVASAGGRVQSLARALALLEEVARIERGAALGDLAARVGLAPSTAHRLLKSLEAARFVTHDSERGLWFVGVKAFNVGAAFLGARDVVALARPAMRALMEESGESVNLAALEDGEIIFLAQVECRQMMRALSRPGGTAPLHASGVGKALLAALPDDEAARLVGGGPFARFTPGTIVAPAKLAAEHAATRRRGYAVDDEEFAPGLRCVAAAIWDGAGRPVAALSLSGPSARITDGRIDQLGRLVCDRAMAITQAIGGRSTRTSPEP